LARSTRPPFHSTRSRGPYLVTLEHLPTEVVQIGDGHGPAPRHVFDCELRAHHGDKTLRLLLIRTSGRAPSRTTKATAAHPPPNVTGLLAVRDARAAGSDARDWSGAPAIVMRTRKPAGRRRFFKRDTGRPADEVLMPEKKNHFPLPTIRRLSSRASLGLPPPHHTQH
jgi:hypothetical protein